MTDFDKNHLELQSSSVDENWDELIAKGKIEENEATTIFLGHRGKDINHDKKWNILGELGKELQDYKYLYKIDSSGFYLYLGIIGKLEIDQQRIAVENIVELYCRTYERKYPNDRALISISFGQIIVTKDKFNGIEVFVSDTVLRHDEPAIDSAKHLVYLSEKAKLLMDSRFKCDSVQYLMGIGSKKSLFFCRSKGNT